jgi:hypothetical protein
MKKILREKHETPESVARQLLRAGGTNRFGKENYRAVWGWNRLTLIGGEWEQKNEDGAPEQWAYRWVPKYTETNRWHIEKWMPPELYGSPWTWWGTEKERELGPYPVRGEYEHVFTLQGKSGEFVQLTATIAERIAHMIKYAQKFPKSASKAALYRREAKADRDYEEWAYDQLTDQVPAFHDQPFVSVA